MTRPARAQARHVEPAVARAGQSERADGAQERGRPGPEKAQEACRAPDRQPDADQLVRQHELDQVVVGVQARLPAADGVGDLRPHDTLLRPVDDLPRLEPDLRTHCGAGVAMRRHIRTRVLLPRSASIMRAPRLFFSRLPSVREQVGLDLRYVPRQEIRGGVWVKGHTSYRSCRARVSARTRALSGLRPGPLCRTLP